MRQLARVDEDGKWLLPQLEVIRLDSMRTYQLKSLVELAGYRLRSEETANIRELYLMDAIAFGEGTWMIEAYMVSLRRLVPHVFLPAEY